MHGIEEKFELLPEVSEHIIEGILSEVKKFASLMKHDPKEAIKSVIDEVEWLKSNKDFLGKAVEASVDSALELYSDRLSHKDWTELRTLLLKGVLLVLQAINESLKEDRK